MVFCKCFSNSSLKSAVKTSIFRWTAGMAENFQLLIDQIKRKWGDREGGSRRWPGYVMSTRVIFRRAEVFLLGEVCLPRRPHAVLLRSQVLSEKRKWWRTWKADEYIFSFKHRTEVGPHADVSEDFRLSKNNFRGHDISQGLDREPPSLSPHFLLIKWVLTGCCRQWELKA